MFACNKHTFMVAIDEKVLDSLFVTVQGGNCMVNGPILEARNRIPRRRCALHRRIGEDRSDFKFRGQLSQSALASAEITSRSSLACCAPPRQIQARLKFSGLICVFEKAEHSKCWYKPLSPVSRERYQVAVPERGQLRTSLVQVETCQFRARSYHPNEPLRLRTYLPC